MEHGKRKIVLSDPAVKKQKVDLNLCDNSQMPPDSVIVVETEKNVQEQFQTQKSELANDLDVKKTIRESRKAKSRRPGFSDESYNETSYYFENGLRKVYPYYFTFTTYSKGRWVGRKLLDVFTKEFRAHSASEYERCIKAGTLTVNGEKVETDYLLKHNDLLANIVHRHEVPVSSDPISIIHVDDDILVINKPASIPVHPCGRYRHNTVVFILGKEYDLKGLRTIHRLDRLTSGLLMFGRTLQRASTIEEQIRKREVQKEYVCRVEGDFPDGEIVCEERIEVVSYKIGVCRVSPKGKTCSTIFQKLSFNGVSSVVSCKPHTGRMHQIRVHLQYLGFPIINDPLYNHTVFGPEKGKGGNIGKSNEDLIKELTVIHNAESWLGTESLLKPLTQEVCAEKSADKQSETLCGNVIENENPKDEANSSEELLKEDGAIIETSDTKLGFQKITSDENCYECKVKYRDPKPSDLVMYLHALRYQGPDWSYQTDLPDWAKDDWTE